RRRDLALHGLQHEPVQLFLRLDVPVERHDAHLQVLGDPAHADRGGPLGVRDGDRDVHDVRLGQPAGPATRSPAAVFPGPVDRRDDLPLAGPLLPGLPVVLLHRAVQPYREKGPVIFFPVFAHEPTSTAFPPRGAVSAPFAAHRTAIVQRTRERPAFSALEVVDRWGLGVAAAGRGGPGGRVRRGLGRFPAGSLLDAVVPGLSRLRYISLTDGRRIAIVRRTITSTLYERLAERRHERHARH